MPINPDQYDPLIPKKYESLKHTFIFLIACIVHLNYLFGQSTAKPKTDNPFVCTPCGYDCDEKSYEKGGMCKSCNMPLVKRSTIYFKTIEPSAICAYVKKHPSVVLLDVRTREEFEGKGEPDFGTLKNAINIPIQELESKLNTLKYLTKRDIIVFCSHSHRSPRAAYILNQNGFKQVTNMAGGMSVMKDQSCMKISKSDHLKNK